MLPSQESKSHTVFACTSPLHGTRVLIPPRGPPKMADYSPNRTYSAYKNTHFSACRASKIHVLDQTNCTATYATSLRTRGCAQHASTISLSRSSVGGTVTHITVWCWRTTSHHDQGEWEQPTHYASVVHSVGQHIDTITSPKASDQMHLIVVHSAPGHTPPTHSTIDGG